MYTSVRAVVVHRIETRYWEMTYLLEGWETAHLDTWIKNIAFYRTVSKHRPLTRDYQLFHLGCRSWTIAAGRAAEK